MIKKIDKYLIRLFSWDKFNIWEIRKDALTSLTKNISGRASERGMVTLYYDLLPLCMSLFLIFLGIYINESSSNYFIAGVSIFIGLFFSLLFVVVDKLNKKYNEIKTSKKLNSRFYEDEKNYFLRYKIFSEQQVSIISYSIIQCIWLVILMFLCKQIFSSVNSFVNKFEFMFYVTRLLRILLNFTTYLLGGKLLILLFVILSNMYTILMEDIKSSNIDFE